jgi:crotonobetaine/carnitine-CoA ligase
MLHARARQHGDQPLVQAGETRWTFAEALELAARSAGRLQAAGIRAGDRVALICENRPEFIEVFLGAAWLGAILVPINVASRGLQLRHILENSGARLMVVEAALMVALEHVRLETLKVETIWVIDRPGDDVPVPLIAQPLPPLGEVAPAGAARPSDTLAILYTSGTTGPSKGVCCPHAQYFWWGVNTAHLLGVREDDVLCTPLPLFHTNALNTLFQALITGATAIFESRFSASGFFQTLATRKATVTYLLGAMVPILL